MTAKPVFDIPTAPCVAIAGNVQVFPVRRVFCVGRNYAAHAAEMGAEVDRAAPFYFTKSAHAVTPSGSVIAYPPGTRDCHYEMELVIAIGAGAFEVDEAEALDAVYGYACGIDLTRRDLQGAAKEGRKPWDLGKDFENSAIVGAITMADAFGRLGDRSITLDLDGRRMQEARLSDMMWSVPEIVAHLSRYYHLAPGDLIFTGTPAGVGPVAPGSMLSGSIDGLESITLTIAG
ncbi:fumarylacetoacetate hydrolase family protein [Roseovarius sp. M141]|uniref:fumarylacetoacetate hydrolase family protein n=1 Tax=Roseovarius sp. M141 TaxID=2583806 RepID=UPI0020CC552D|nr:fumarylacetoacetate hydrolase family protein [Roseovarius sp. M141]MCQ0092400.1 fumarylacetoacetate hydrolase family protein [Roseovarius sp. M141]